VGSVTCQRLDLTTQGGADLVVLRGRAVRRRPPPPPPPASDAAAPPASRPAAGLASPPPPGRAAAGCCGRGTWKADDGCAWPDIEALCAVSHKSPNKLFLTALPLNFSLFGENGKHDRLKICS